MKSLRALLLASLALLPGCAWLAAQDFDVCVEYKGRHVCVGRKDGKWTFGVDQTEGPALSAADEEDIRRGIESR